MKATSLCYMLAATAVAGSAGAQEVLTEYMDTSFGWDPAVLEIDDISICMQQTLPAREQMSRRHAGVPTPRQLVQLNRRHD